MRCRRVVDRLARARPRTPDTPEARGGAASRLKYRVDEGRQRLDRRSDHEHETRDAEKDRQRNEPAPAAFRAPETSRELADRRHRAADHDETTPDLASFSDHPAFSMGRGAASVPACFSTTQRPATRTSMPHLRNSESASTARFT